MSGESCGCCQPANDGRLDEVRNRSGLPAITYRVGTFLSFRQALLDSLSRTPELAALRTRRPDDYAITVIELWAVVADVITFYQERIANEAFLGTARIRDSVVRLARLIDYQLGPGAAALTRLSFTVDPGQVVPLPAGLRAQSRPAEGEKPQKYETLHALVADAALNEIQVRPLPVAVNPVARGSMGGHLVAGPEGLAAAAQIKPTDLLVVFSSGAMETLEVESVSPDVDRLLVRWTRPIENAGWTLTTPVRRLARTFRLFGHNAVSSYMTPAADATFPGGIRWTLNTGTSTFYNLPKREEVYLDGRVEELEPGVWILISVGGTQNRLVQVTSVTTDTDTLGALTDTVTRITTFPSPQLSGVDRRRVLLHELPASRVRFSGYAYPETIATSTVVAPGRAVDGTHIEVNQQIDKGELQPGVVVDIDRIERDRPAVLADQEHESLTVSIQRRRITQDEVVFAATPDDTTTAAALGLDAEHAHERLVLVGAERPVSFLLTRAAGEIAVSIGNIGPVIVPVVIVAASVPADLSAAQSTLQAALSAAHPAPAFAETRVTVAEDRLVIVPGIAGARVAISPTPGDPTTALELGLDGTRASTARALLSSPLPFPLATTDPQPTLAVTIGPFGPMTARLRARPTTAASAATMLENALNSASLLPVFAYARVRLLFDRLIMLPGPVGVEHQAFLEMGFRASDPPFTVSTRSAVMFANVARASHGVAVRNETLGDGQPAEAFQEFTLARRPVTFVPESTGIVSTLRVEVNRVLWQEVPTLFGHGPDDQVYRARVADDGTMTVQFGDGIEGARPPAGRNNIVATYREGSGLAGRVRAGAIATALDRPKGLRSVTNPVPATGGADPETLAQARTNAPNTVRTFGRIVSLRDFEDEARVSGEVAKARATVVSDGLGRAIHLTVAGQQGALLGADNLRALHASLGLRRDPNQTLLLPDGFVRVPIVIAGTVRIDPARASDVVIADARAALLAGLGFDQLGFGQSVNLSDVYTLLQNVPGVIASDIDLFHFKHRTPAQLAARRATAHPVQPRLRIFAARPNPAPPPRIVPAEQAWIETPDTDVVLRVSGGVGG
jgi:predicted phage baseplate assembly protein